ncbi:hypothetical protein N9O69_05160 [Alphaproteobacteria bacterium]|nr:hypothetical protein [Alphaproteobacteria bacterium]
MNNNKINGYLKPLELIEDAETELGILSLSSKDKIVLKSVIKQFKHNKEVKITYNDFCNENSKFISRSQFFKSVKNLIKKNILNKVGKERGSTFQINS